MTKIIVLSTVLALSAMGMACGDAGTNVNVNAKMANTMAPVSTPAAMNTATPVSSMTPAMNANAPKTNMMAPNANAPKTNTMAPTPSATKKP